MVKPKQVQEFSTPYTIDQLQNFDLTPRRDGLIGQVSTAHVKSTRSMWKHNGCTVFGVNKWLALVPKASRPTLKTLQKLLEPQNHMIQAFYEVDSWHTVHLGKRKLYHRINGIGAKKRQQFMKHQVARKLNQQK
ncbi:hypothetical protein D8B26_002535 [Coccidioides posadasii str. Silveira]|uniref:Predicted protein n=1 Tax=Coccidioides posadasii (strain RMSCC 757 / Silveira) TaxID=443226 RepID=E9DIX0_COCPS|nr:predicted protein [Coccidioides posadasii str. Silveira]QVM07841.1 hypothetical protein D8B26_002535 [Coccidioides posadasii str. Silveira]